MSDRSKLVDVTDAIKDLRERTLARLPCEMAKLVYLASTRDYSTGEYHHEGLIYRYSSQIARAALHSCHERIFEEMLVIPLQQFVLDVDTFFRSRDAKPLRIVEAWKEIEPYRVVIPQKAGAVSRHLFFSNVRIALAILERRQAQDLPRDQQFA
jgi:hypothetical protein